MKIRIINPIGDHKNGDIVEALMSPKHNFCVAFDSSGTPWKYFEGYEIVDTSKEYISKDKIKSIADLLGKDIKKITVEF